MRVFSKNLGLMGEIAVLVVICCLGTVVQGKYGGGTGEPNDPYLIYTAEQMNTIGADSNDWDKRFKLMADIDLSGLSGENYRNIENCCSYCTIVGGGGGGLIGSNHGIVNQCCSRSIVSGWGEVGGLVGRNYGLITNSYSDSSVTSDTYGAGGLVGDNWDTILSCYALGKVSGDSWVGGLIGEGGFWFDRKLLCNC